MPEKVLQLQLIVPDSFNDSGVINLVETFNPVPSVFTVPNEIYPKYKDTITVYEIFADGKGKALVTLPSSISITDLREVMLKVIAGQFDNLTKDSETLKYQGGAVGDKSSYLPFGWELGVIDGLGAIINALKKALNWIPWWAWAGGAAFLTYKTADSRSKMGQVLFGAGSVYTAYRAIKKYKQ